MGLRSGARTAAQLAIEVAMDAASALSGFDDVSRGARDMGEDVKRAGDDVAEGARSVAEGADEMASKSAQLAGGLGDLGGALGMLPGPLGSLGGGMEALSAPIMGVTGAADLLNVALESQIGQLVKGRVVTIAQSVAQRAAAVATNVMAVAQRALNAAMRANPVGLIITALTLLVAGIVLAYKRSETFRGIVDKLWGAIRTAASWVGNLVRRMADAVGGLDGIRDKAGRVGTWLRDVFVGYLQLVTTPWRLMGDAIGRVIDLLGKIRVPDALGKVGDLVGGILGSAPVNVGRVALSGGVGRLDPRAGITASLALGAGGVLSYDAGTSPTPSSTDAGVTYVDARTFVNVDGALDATGVADQIIELLQRRGRQLGGLQLVAP